MTPSKVSQCVLGLIERMVTRSWVLVMLWCTGICTANNVTDEVDTTDGEDINISINKLHKPKKLLHQKVTTENGINDMHISKQININLNLGSTNEFLKEKACPNQTNNRDIYSDSPNPFYEFVKGFGYYKLHTEERSWYEAKSICEKEGAHLAIINSKEELKVLVEMRNRLPKLLNNWRDDTQHIGVNDIDNEGEWMTIFGERIESTGFPEWGAGYPDKGREKNCAVFKPSIEVFHTAGCDWKFGFYCEKEISIPS